MLSRYTLIILWTPWWWVCSCSATLDFKSNFVREKLATVLVVVLAPFGLAEFVERESGSRVYECGPQFVNVVRSCAAFRSAVGAHVCWRKWPTNPISPTPNCPPSLFLFPPPSLPMSLMNEASNRRQQNITCLQWTTMSGRPVADGRQ